MKEFNETIVMDLEYWLNDPDIGLHIIVHGTCCSVSCCIISKRKELSLLVKFFQIGYSYWMSKKNIGR